MFALQIEELHLAHAKVPQSNTLAVDASVVGTAELPRASAGAPQAGSLSLMLVQALHSNDATLLEQVCRPFEKSKSRILPHYYPFCIIVLPTYELFAVPCVHERQVGSEDSGAVAPEVRRAVPAACCRQVPG